jgi:L-ascorbate oxidase
MICVFNWTLENYIVLNQAYCGNCPENLQDCSRPDCVAANGFVRQITVINHMLPGPLISVCQKDVIRVNFYNAEMDHTAIHWHGINQRNSSFMDGVPFVSQCPIMGKSYFQYEYLIFKNFFSI